jgi:large subunit ribosomal protein L6e
VILLKALDQGVLLVTGPFKINGVPLRRINARYVIATSKKVDIGGCDSKKVEAASDPSYFVGNKEKEKANEEAFFKQGEKPKVATEPMPYSFPRIAREREIKRKELVG